MAWHGDRIGRSKDLDTMVAILSVGWAGSLMLRPARWGPSRCFALGHGDLVVLGGSCQRTWDQLLLLVLGLAVGAVSRRLPSSEAGHTSPHLARFMG